MTEKEKTVYPAGEHRNVARMPAASEPLMLNPQSLIAQAIDKGASIETLERLVALAKDMRTVMAREAWYEAMATFQSSCPPIKKTATARITSRTGGGFSYNFAPLDEITSTIQPVMGPLGLSYSWVTLTGKDAVTAICKVAHRLGHVEESGGVTMPVILDAQDRGANAAQRVGIALTYAKRYALLGVLGLAPEDDDDGGETPGRSEDEPSRVNQDAQDRQGLLDAIREKAAQLAMSKADGDKLWNQIIGKGVKQGEADIGKLVTLVTVLDDAISDRAKAGQHTEVPF